MSGIRVLIVDDEEPARLRLRDLLAEEQDIRILDELENGSEAVRAIETLSPDLVFLDIQMPEIDGLGVVSTLAAERMPLVVFVTAYNQHAIRAFELCALDYLLKPFDDFRFRQTMARVRARLKLEKLEGFNQKLVSLIDEMSGHTHQPPIEYPPARIGVKHRGRLILIPTEQIDFISADGPYAEIHKGNQTYLIREKMSELEAKLEPCRFFRIHRSTIVNLDRVESLTPYFHGEYKVKLKNGTQLKLSRTRRQALTKRLGMIG